MPFVNGDSATVNSGGTLTWDIANADGAIDSNAIAVNANGIFEQSAGTRIDINDTFAITIAEGGRWRSHGTSGSHCIINGENIATAGHYITTYRGGKFFSNYTDIAGFYYGFYTNLAGIVEMHNTTLGAGTGDGIYAYNGASCLFLVNCTIAAGATTYCLRGSYEFIGTFINCAFTSNNDNRLGYSTYSFNADFCGCTYQGLPLEADDFGYTGCDIGVRIYKKSVLTDTESLSNVSVAPSHPSLDANGLLYDDTNYFKSLGFLGCPSTDTGVSTLYLLQKSGYWPSGLAVESRTWKYWSDGGEEETGDNQKWTVVCSKEGYYTDTDTQWAGTAMGVTMNPIEANIQGEVVSYSNSDTTTYAAKFVSGAVAYFDGSVTLDQTLSGVTVKIEIYNDADELQETVLNTTDDYTADTPITLKTTAGGTAPNYTTDMVDVFYAKLTVSKSGYVTEEVWTQYFDVYTTSEVVISGAALDNNSITLSETATVSCTIGGTPDYAGVFIDDFAMQLTNTVGSTWAASFQGEDIGSTGGSPVTVSLVAGDSVGSDVDENLSITVAADTTAVEAVTHVYNLLSGAWDSDNVATPQFIIGGTFKGSKHGSAGDIVKIYRSPKPVTRDVRYRGTHEDRSEYVQVQVVTTYTTSSTDPRARLEALKDEIIRIINYYHNEPGGTWHTIWLDMCDVRGEFADKFVAVMDITLKKIAKYVLRSV